MVIANTHNHDVSIDGLLPSLQKPLGVHHIRTKLFSIPLSLLNKLLKEAQAASITDSNSAKYRLVSIIMEIANYRLFNPVTSTANYEE